MSFRSPVVLIALVAVPLLLVLHDRRRRGDAAAMASFSTSALLASVAPQRPGWRVRGAGGAGGARAGAADRRRGAPAAHASPSPVTDGAVMLADDTSSSMAATDVSPSRLGAAVASARRFIAERPGDDPRRGR